MQLNLINKANNKEILVSAFSCLTLWFGYCNFALADSYNIIADTNHDNHSMPMKNEGHSNGNHHHTTLEVSKVSAIPEVKISVEKDPISGWNLHIKTSNFRFAPESVNEGNSANEGHAHLYVNGKKMNRIYSNWFHLIDLPKGENEVKVTLNSNGHQTLVYQGKVIGDTIIINNP